MSGVEWLLGKDNTNDIEAWDMFRWIGAWDYAEWLHIRVKSVRTTPGEYVATMLMHRCSDRDPEVSFPFRIMRPCVSPIEPVRAAIQDEAVRLAVEFAGWRREH